MGLNLLLQDSTIALSTVLPETRSWFAQSTIKILFLVAIPIRTIKAICEKILIVLPNNNINIKPPRAAYGTVNITTKGCLQALKVPAITR